MVRLSDICIEPNGSIEETSSGGNIVERVVYQRVDPRFSNCKTVGGLLMQRRRHVIPFDPRTPAQVANRTAFANAVIAWRQATPGQKESLKNEAKRRGISVYNLFISKYLKGEL